MATEPAPADDVVDEKAVSSESGSSILGKNTVEEPKKVGQPAHDATASGLVWLDRNIGPPWSMRALRYCLGLALIYCWIAYFLSWGLGASGEIGQVPLLADPPQPARLLSAFSAILLPLVAMILGRTLGRFERRAKLCSLRRLRRKQKQRRRRLRLVDFERRYRWLLGLLFGAALVTVLIWFRRGDVAAFTILFSWLSLGPVSGIAMARRFSSPTNQGLAALIAGFGSITGAVLLILAFAGAGVSAFAFAVLGITNVAFVGALGVLLEIVMGGMLTLGLALAGAGAATVALALAGAGTGIATLTGVATMSRAGLAAFMLLMGGASLATLTFGEAAVLSAAIGGISAIAVAAAVSHNQRGRHGAYAGAIGAMALFTSGAVILGWGHRPLVIFAICFFFLLPLINGFVDWIAWAMTRNVTAYALTMRHRFLSIALSGIAFIVIGIFLVSSLAFSLGFGFEAYNRITMQRAGLAAFDLQPMIGQAIISPWGEGLWMTLMLLTPLLPIAFQISRFLSDGLLRLQPDDYPLRRPIFNVIGFLMSIATFIAVAWAITASSTLNPAQTLGDMAYLGIQTAADVFATQRIN